MFSPPHTLVFLLILVRECFTSSALNTWLAIDKHPDAQIFFDNRKIPHFEKCLETALELNKSVPYVRCVGWDTIVDNKQNVKVMGWNGYHNDIKFSEATQGPVFFDLGWEIVA